MAGQGRAAAVPVTLGGPVASPAAAAAAAE